PPEGQVFSASLDHAMYFHRPLAADRWHLQTFTCHGLMSSRGVSDGYVFTEECTHEATVVQEVQVRRTRPRGRATRRPARSRAQPVLSSTRTPAPGRHVRTTIVSPRTCTDDAPSRSTSKASNCPTSNR